MINYAEQLADVGLTLANATLASWLKWMELADNPGDNPHAIDISVRTCGLCHFSAAQHNMIIGDPNDDECCCILGTNKKCCEEWTAANVILRKWIRAHAGHKRHSQIAFQWYAKCMADFIYQQYCQVLAEWGQL